MEKYIDNTVDRCHVYRSKIVRRRTVDWHKIKDDLLVTETGVPWAYIYPADPRRYGSRDRLYPIFPCYNIPTTGEAQLAVIIDYQHM